MRMADKNEIERVRDRVSISDIIGAYVELKTAGVGAKKGLCPFHDEKTPSFVVRESVGTFHCFGCGESGDVFSFIMKVNGIDFPEALEYLAQKSGINIVWQEAQAQKSTTNPNDEVRRIRIIEANNQAQKYYADQLKQSEAAPARQMLFERNFTRADYVYFGCGYAPRGRDNLVRHLSNQGFTHFELVASGLVTKTSNAILDRFQGRLLWPIRDVMGDVLGFGARHIYDDDFFDAKYLNTSETRVYKKSKVLYGIDLARKPIANKREVVVVEGYTDVMAMHLAGVDTAVASCGTAFGHEHAQIARRLMGDMDASNMLVSSVTLQQAGRIIFTFDGDDAGMKAALKAFSEDQGFISQTYVAIVPDGLDPCDLRVKQGNVALANLVKSAVPMFEFIIKTILKGFDLISVEGRITAVRSAAMIISQIRDIALRPEYTRQLALWTGVKLNDIERIISQTRKGVSSLAEQQFNTTSSIPVISNHKTNRSAEMNLISIVLQYPWQVNIEHFNSLTKSDFENPFLAKIFEHINQLGGIEIGAVLSSASWVVDITQTLDERSVKAINQLATAPLPVAKEDEVPLYSTELIKHIRNKSRKQQIEQLRTQLPSFDPSSQQAQETFSQIMQLELELRNI